MKKMLVGLMVWLMAAMVHADLVMQVMMVDHEGGEDARETMEISMTGDKLRMDTVGLPGSVTIARKDKDMLWMLRTDKKIYSELSMPEMLRMHKEAEEQSAATRAMMESSMAGLSEQEKMEMRASMGLDEAEEAPLQYVKKGEARVGKWNCILYDGMYNGEKREEICTVPLKTLGVQKSDFDVLFWMSMEKGSKFSEKEWMEIEGRGFPVKTVRYDEGGILTTEEVTRMEKKTLEASLFDLPSGFGKVSMMEFYGE